MLTVAAVFMATPLMAQPEVVTWKTKVTHVKDDVYRVTFDVDIQSGWHIYDMGPYEGGPTATTFTFDKSPNLELVGKVTPVKPQPKHFDEVWQMEIGYVEGKGSFTQDVKLKGDKATLKGIVEWQSCDDQSCLPPMDYEFSVEIKAVKPVADATPAGAETTTGTTAATAAVAASVEVEQPTADADETPQASNSQTDGQTIEQVVTVTEEQPQQEDNSFWGLILQAIVWGFVSLLTPCVFPMVPVTVSFFMKGSENKAAARFRASSFGIFIIILYTLPVAVIVLLTMLFGGDDGVAGVFNWFSTHWLPNIVFFIVFMIFAASFFGAFEITLPSGMVNKSDSKSDKGGLVGVFFMALTLVLVSFSCTGPLVGNVIASAAQGSTVWWQPIVIMLVFSTVFAIPFTLLAFVPSLMTKLKSGSWLNAVKVSLGFVEIALGFKFLMVIDQSYGLHIFSRELYLAIWIVCGLLWALYLLGVYKTKHDSDVPYIGPLRLTFAIIVLVFTVWMMPGMLGANLKPLSGYMPPSASQEFNVATVGSLQGISVSGTQNGEQQGGAFINPLTGKAPKFSDMGIHAPEGFSAFFDVQEATEYAKSVNKPLFIDITGIACVNCREMEQNVWTDPTVAKILREDYVMVCVFLDVKQDLPEEYWVTDDRGRVQKQMGKINTAWSMKNFSQVAQPLYVLKDPRDDKMLGPTRAYNKDVAAYVQWLQDGLNAYKTK